MSGVPEPLSDGDMVFERDEATVDRMARHGGYARERRHYIESWGFRIRHLFVNLMK